jgi:hypothetical protein
MKLFSTHLIAATLAAGLALASASATAGAVFSLPTAVINNPAVSITSFPGNIVSTAPLAPTNSVSVGSFTTNAVYSLPTTVNPATTQFIATAGNTNVTAAAATTTALPIFTVMVVGVPEPKEYLMMLLGLGLIGYVATRRKQNIGTATYA